LNVVVVTGNGINICKTNTNNSFGLILHGTVFKNLSSAHWYTASFRCVSQLPIPVNLAIDLPDQFFINMYDDILLQNLNYNNIDFYTILDDEITKVLRMF